MSVRRVSMADIAAAAGVSAQTVSRVVNQSPRVDPATRARVEAAMQELGYRIHRAARTLRTGRSHTLGLIADSLATIGNSRMLQSVADASRARGYTLVVTTLGGEGDIDDAFEHLREQGADGAIVLNEATALVGDRVPDDLELVVVDTPDADRSGVVQTDHARGAVAATTHLLDLGHDTVAHVAGPVGSFAAFERERGWRAALAAHGREPGPLLRGDGSSGSGYRAGLELAAVGRDPSAARDDPAAARRDPAAARRDPAAARRDPVPARRDPVPSGEDVTAVFAANDQMALGLLRAFGENGHRVPDEVSVVGFDDIADAAQFRPPLTTIRQDFDALGEGAVAALIDAIDGKPRVAQSIEGVLIVRSSTAPPQTARP